MKRITLAVLPLILSACSSSHPDASLSRGFDITRVQSGKTNKSIAVQVDAPLNKLTIFKNTHPFSWKKSIEYTDGKLLRETRDTSTYGTVVKALVTETADNSRVVSLDISHTCRPEMRKYTPVDGNWIEVPQRDSVSTKQTIQIIRGETILITGKGFDTSCTFPRIAIRPNE